jgi:hypothetical protein
VPLKIQSLCDNKIHTDKSCKSIKFLLIKSGCFPAAYWTNPMLELLVRIIIMWD